ncbi:MAG: iron chelate uptake ABC transporter family permease subunit [Planctomycetota bacterium]|nr:iron chelate uptake ABC transporter family permease subunit [Planctomycetota bacterium]
MDKAQLMEWHVANAGMIKALIAGSFISIACGVIGCFIVLRRMSFLADAVAHAMLAGVVASYLLLRAVFGFQANSLIILVGAMFAGLLTVALIGFVTKVSRVKEDAAIGIMYTGIFALGGFFASIKSFSEYIDVDLVGFITGSVVTTSLADLWMLAVISIVVFTAVIMFYRQLLLTSFDPVMAASIGIPVLAIDYLLTACTSLVVVCGVNIVGVILVVALLITPAATAHLLFDRLHRMLIGSAVFGLLGFWSGYFVSMWTGNAPGPSVVVMSTLIFLITLVVAPRYGLIANWLRKRNQVPQEFIEDIMGYILKTNGQTELKQITRELVYPGFSTKAAIQILEKEDLIHLKNGAVQLTPTGERTAKKLRRAHRLWETYLQSTGMAADQVHEKAHLLEHVNDEEAVDYLDHKLGHPLTDPHGAEIPEDFVHIEAGGKLRLSLLREGDIAIITNAGEMAVHPQFTVGSRIEIGPRISSNLWTAKIIDNGMTFKLDHPTADTVIVLKENTQTAEKP